MDWIKIDEENKLEFDKEYILAKTRKQFLSGNFKVIKYYGWLKRIETTECGNTYHCKVFPLRTMASYVVDKITNPTHFIEVRNIPKIRKEDL